MILFPLNPTLGLIGCSRLREEKKKNSPFPGLQVGLQWFSIALIIKSKLLTMMSMAVLLNIKKKMVMVMFEKLKINGRGVLWSWRFGGDIVYRQDGGICRQRGSLFSL